MDASQQLSQLIANSKTADQIPNAETLQNSDYLFIYVVGAGWRKIQKSKIVFTGETVSKSIHLEDMPSSLLGQDGKILVVEDGVFKLTPMADVDGVTEAELSQAISDLESKVVKTVNNQEPDESGNVTVEAGTSYDDTEITQRVSDVEENKAEADLSNLSSDLTEQQNQIIRSKIGAADVKEVIKGIRKADGTLLEVDQNRQVTLPEITFDETKVTVKLENISALYEGSEGETIQTLGYFENGDGGGGIYYWDATSTEAPDAALILQVEGVVTGRWKKVDKDYLNIKHFGARVDGVTDDTVAIQKMIDSFGYFKLPIGTAKITQPLKIKRANSFFDSIYSGYGAGLSEIVCEGMQGLAAIEPTNTDHYIRVVFKDFKISGEVENAINLTTNLQVYQSRFENLILSTEGSCFVANKHFSTSWYNVHTYSDSGHGFDLQGGNSTVLTNCYAHRSGSGKAGYRIKGHALLIACNGVDDGDIWGWFGASTEEDGEKVIARVTMIGCNIEDFDVRGLYFAYKSNITLQNTSFTPKSEGTYEDLIYITGADNRFKSFGSTVGSKGSTRVATSNIITEINGAFSFAESADVGFSDYFSEQSDIIYRLPYIEYKDVQYGKKAWKIPFVDFERNYGFNLQMPSTVPENTVDLDVTGKTKIRTSNTEPTIVRRASTGAQEGQELYINVKDEFTTIQHNYASNGGFINKSGKDITASDGDIYHYVYNGAKWVEIGSITEKNITDTERTFTEKQTFESIEGKGVIDRTEKLIDNTTQYTILAEDVDKILKFTANAGEEIQLIYNENTLPDNSKSIVAMSTGDNILIPTVGTGSVTFGVPAGSLLKTTGENSLITLQPKGSVNDLRVGGDLEKELANETRNELVIQGSYNLDWQFAVHQIELTGDTTLTDENLPTDWNTKVIELIVTGDFALTLPAYWTGKPSNDDYSGTVENHIVVSCINGNSGSEKVIYSLENLA